MAEESNSENQETIIRVEDYDIYLQESKFGNVYFAINTESGEFCEAHIFENVQEKKDIPGLLNLELAQKLNGIGVLTMKGVTFELDNMGIVFTDKIETSLEEYLNQKENIELSEKEALFYLFQLIKSVHILHYHGQSHLNLTPDNIFINGQNVFLGFFGEEENTENQANSIYKKTYVFPEFLEEVELGKKSKAQLVDIWSLGIIFFRMIYGTLPFTLNGETDLDVEHVLRFTGVNLRFPKVPQISKNVQRLLRRLLDRNKLHEMELKQILSLSCFDSVRHHLHQESSTPSRETSLAHSLQLNKSMYMGIDRSSAPQVLKTMRINNQINKILENEIGRNEYLSEWNKINCIYLDCLKEHESDEKIKRHLEKVIFMILVLKGLIYFNTRKLGLSLFSKDIMNELIKRNSHILKHMLTDSEWNAIIKNPAVKEKFDELSKKFKEEKVQLSETINKFLQYCHENYPRSLNEQRKKLFDLVLERKEGEFYRKYLGEIQSLIKDIQAMYPYFQSINEAEEIITAGNDVVKHCLLYFYQHRSSKTDWQKFRVKARYLPISKVERLKKILDEEHEKSKLANYISGQWMRIAGIVSILFIAMIIAYWY